MKSSKARSPRRNTSARGVDSRSITPIKIADGPSRTYEQAGRHFSGDWFASRSVQAQRADAVVPSRAEIMVVNAEDAAGGAPPVLTSSVPAALRTVAYLDPAGRRWVGEGLRTGERVTLHAGEAPLASTFSPDGSVGLDAEVKRLLERRGSFVADADELVVAFQSPAAEGRLRSAQLVAEAMLSHE